MSSAAGKINKKRKHLSVPSNVIAKGDLLKISNPKPSDRSVSQKRLRINQSLSSKLHELTDAEEVPSILQSHGRITGAKNGNVWNFKIATQHEESFASDSVEEAFDGKELRVIPSVERLRHRCVSESRDHLRKLCLEKGIIPPLMAWERWQANRMLTQQIHQRDSKFGLLTLQHSSSSNMFSRKAESTKKAVVEYILPLTDHVDEGLVSDLLRGGVRDKEQAIEISRKMSCQSMSLVEKVKEFERACKLSLENPKNTGNKKKQRRQERAQTASMIDVLPMIVKHKHTYDVSFGNTSKNVLKLNCTHYNKLKELYVLTQKLDCSFNATTADESEGKENPNCETAVISADSNMQEFHDCLYVLLARYNALLGHGMQCALPEEVFEVLHDHVQTNFECFASPLNCRYPSYCSAFPDTDSAFGSKGSFFNFYPTRGSYEVNPPFIESIMTEAVTHAHSLLSVSEDALSFTFIVPGWIESAAYQMLKQSAHLVLHVAIAAKDHGYCSGAQHQRKDRYLEAPYDTIVFVLQNKRGKSEHGTTICTTNGAQLFEKDLRAAFSTAIPTEAMKQRRLKEGRGFGDLDGGGGVYKGKKQNKNKSPPA